jgi:hypothetical protein
LYKVMGATQNLGFGFLKDFVMSINQVKSYFQLV